MSVISNDAIVKNADKPILEIDKGYVSDKLKDQKKNKSKKKVPEVKKVSIENKLSEEEFHDRAKNLNSYMYITFLH